MADRLKRRRNAIRNNLINKVIPSVENTLQSDAPQDDNFNIELATSEALIKDLFNEVKTFDNQIFDSIEDDDFETETNDTIQFAKHISKTLIKIKRKIEFLNRNNVVQPVINRAERENVNVQQTDRNNVRLSKLNIKTFTGKSTERPTYIETFEAAIDKNETIGNVQKFQYFKGYLSGQAEKCIDNLLLTNDNYVEALNLLKEGFGNTQLIINAHVSILMKTSVVEEGNVHRLRNFLDTVERHVRALGNQDVNKEHFGAILIPVIQDILPYNIRVELNRKMGKDNWKLD